MSCGGTYFGVGFTGACGCGCGGFGGCIYNVNVPENTDSTLLFNNINLTGVGVLDSATAPNINFRGVASGSPQLTVALDAGNHTIVLTLDVAAITAAIPQATTAQAGIGETATDAEALAKASVTVFVTPSNFAAMAATTTFAGLVELATNAEALAGASTTLAVTPDDLAYVLANSGLTTTFADAVARAAAVPAFVGQFGYQVDTLTPYSGDGLAAGNWLPIAQLGTSQNLVAFTTTFDLTAGASWVYSSGDSTGIVSFSGVTANVENLATLSIEALSNLNFAAFSKIKAAGVTVPASSVLLTSANAGELTSALQTTFLSSANTQTGWAVTNPVVNRSLDVSAATLGDVREVLGTLINDIKALKVPAT